MAELRRALYSLIHLALLATPIAVAASEGDAPPPKRVLAVYEHQSTLFAVQEISRGLLATLEKRIPEDLEIYSEYMDAARFPAPDDIEGFRDGVVARYDNVSLDVALAIGPNALTFMLDNRSEIAPGVPIVFGGVSERTAAVAAPHADVGGVISHFDVDKTIELARRLQPGASRIVVMTGSADFDRRWEATARNDLQVFEPEMRIDYVSGLTLDEFKRAAAELPADTILLILSIFMDTTGRRLIPRDVAAEIAATSSAPAYAPYGSFVGIGVVGGFMETFESIGVETAALAAQVMLGEVQAPPTIYATGLPVVDWRQLRRWGIDEAHLPAGTELRFYEPSLWERYRWQILAITAVIALQSTTIAALVVESRRRRRVKEELILERLELARLSRVSQLGELSGALAHELRQPLTSILANAEAGARLLGEDSAGASEIKEILDDIITDDKRAAAVIAQLRHMMSKDEIDLDLIDLNRAVTATMKLANSELLARQTKIDFHRQQSELPVRGNLAQLQQIVLNLLLNAADAMADLLPAERRIVVETRLREDGFRELAVADRGSGLSPERRMDVFKPFVTSKADGLGLGLAICRSIAQAHGGSLGFDEHRSRGARVVLALPAPS